MSAHPRRDWRTRSLGVAVALVFLYASVGYRYRALIEPEYGMDALLWGIWVVMTAAMAWGFDPRRDFPLIVVAACGGFVIEWWGTNSQLWRYFTDERPPLWIIPAWPVAAVSIDRIATLADRTLPIRRLSFGYHPMLLAFVVVMTSFLWPTIDVFASQVVVLLMLAVVLYRPQPRWDVVLFVVGSAVGVFLEYWGTSRYCWTYYTGEQPPPEAVFAHGFASVAFSRGATLLREALSRAKTMVRPTAA